MLPYALAAFLIAFGIGCIALASAIQRIALERVRFPANRLGAWNRGLVGSPTTLRSIRLTGAMCVAAGVAFLVLVVLAAR